LPSVAPRFYRRFASAVIRCSLARVIVLINSTRLKRTADQSSSMATILTGSKPAAPMPAQPLSRLNSHLYFFEVPFGYANQTTASPFAAVPALFASGLLRNEGEQERERGAAFNLTDHRNALQRSQFRLEAFGRVEHYDSFLILEIQLFENGHSV
jgi:hypothetical protein